MPVSNIFKYKLYSDKLSNSSKKLGLMPCWLFCLYVMCIILSLTTKSFSEEKILTEEASGNSIANILNKAIGEKASKAQNNHSGNLPPIKEDGKPDIIDNKKTAGDKAIEVKNNHNNNSLSKIVSSLVKKNNGPSLMFNDEEITKIDQALDAYRNNTPFDAIETKEVKKEQEEAVSSDQANSCIYLESILYHSPDNWSAWINGQKISNTNNSSGSELYIKSINADSVNIVWTMSISKWKILANQTSESGAPINANNQVELNFNLSFNQTYMLVGSKIIEGRIKLGSDEASSAWGHDKKLTDSLSEETKTSTP